MSRKVTFYVDVAAIPLSLPQERLKLLPYRLKNTCFVKLNIILSFSDLYSEMPILAIFFDF